jgi:hypothetical protein
MGNIWVGQLNATALVHDPAIQLQGCSHVFLWNHPKRCFEKYVPEMARLHIRRHPDPKLTSTVLAEYRDWIQTGDAQEWLAAERIYYEQRNAKETAALQASRLAAERHKARLEAMGKQYLGTRDVQLGRKKRRTTHCYSCKASLDNSIQIECAACNWILCACGACGCGYAFGG